MSSMSMPGKEQIRIYAGNEILRKIGRKNTCFVVRIVHAVSEYILYEIPYMKYLR